MEANKVSNFLGISSNIIQNDLFSVSIVNYNQFVSEDWHYHENIHLSSILVGGNLESRKEKDIIVTPGKIIAYEAGEVHRNRYTAFPSKNLNIELNNLFFNDEIRFSNLKPSNDTYLYSMKVYYELLINDSYSNQSIKQIIKSFFFNTKYSKKPEWLDTLLLLLHDRWQEFISLEELSKELGLHPVSISKYFAKYVNCTLADYMRTIKVKHAVHILLTTNKPIAEIAFLCGFSDHSHMNRLFRFYIGFSPKMLRSL